MNPTHVRVYNENPFEVSDRYDGILYRFAPGEKDGRLVPIEAAANIFGFRVIDDEQGYRIEVVVDESGNAVLDKRYLQRRWGWNTIINRRDEDLAAAVARTNAEADAKCAKIRAVPVIMQLREVQTSSVPNVLPPPRELPDEAPPAQHRGKMRV
jgi:hypothetical protein